MTAAGLPLGALLERRARERPDHELIAMPGGVSVTYAEFDARVNRIAHGLAGQGVGRGDAVAVMLPNRLELLLVSYALKKLGALEVAVNTAFRGAALAHMAGLARPRLLVADATLVPALAEVWDRIDGVERMVVCGEGAEPPAGTRTLSFDEVVADRDDPPRVDVRAGDLATVLFTSGTTGRSKGCALSHRYAVHCGESIVEGLGLVPDDRLYCPFPLHHLDAAFLTVVPALLLGATAAIGERFSVSRFWAELRELGATVFDFMGATLTMLWKAEPRPDDADNPARLAWGVPMPSFRRQFEERFGLALAHCYGLTDGGMVSWESPGAGEPHGSCGRPGRLHEVAILDADGVPVPPGTVGEICLRPREPDAVMHGYHGMPEATLEAFRGLWLHTGDQGRLDEAGHLFFAGRAKDAIRRRGENISAFEVEEGVLEHPAVVECAAVGVPSALSEEDVKVFVVLRPGARLEADELRAFCRARMARHMVPEHVAFVAALPKTQTGKVEKRRLVGGA